MSSNYPIARFQYYIATSMKNLVNNHQNFLRVNILSIIWPLDGFCFKTEWEPLVWKTSKLYFGSTYSEEDLSFSFSHLFRVQFFAYWLRLNGQLVFCLGDIQPTLILKCAENNTIQDGEKLPWLDLASFAWVRVWVHLQAQVKGGVFVFAAINHVRVWVDPHWIAAYWLCKYPIQSNRIDVDVYHIIIAGSHVNKCWVPAPWRDFKASPAQRSAASEISIENTYMTSVKHVRVCVGVCVCVSVSVCTPAHFTVTC